MDFQTWQCSEKENLGTKKIRDYLRKKGGFKKRSYSNLTY